MRSASNMTKMLHVRMTTSEWQRMEELATQAELTVSEMVRSMVYRAQVVFPEKEDGESQQLKQEERVN